MRTILVAEDSFALANLLEFVLKRSGFAVCLARNGLAALAVAQHTHFDLMVLDEQMPGMTGTEVLRRLRVASLNKTTLAYLCTAKVHEMDLVSLHTELQLAGVFSKPFSPRELVEALQGSPSSKGATHHSVPRTSPSLLPCLAPFPSLTQMVPAIC